MLNAFLGNGGQQKPLQHRSRCKLILPHDDSDLVDSDFVNFFSENSGEEPELVANEV